VSWLGDLLALYGRVFRQAGVLAGRNLAMALVMLVYQVLLGAVGSVVAPLGFVGGILFQLAVAACASSWLAVVEQVVRGSRPTLAELPASFGRYLGDVLTVTFLVWILQLAASIVLPAGSFLHILLILAIVVFFNAVPELIYLGHYAAAELLTESYRFIAENWVEWFPANVLLGAGLVAIVIGLPHGPGGILLDVVLSVWLYYAMIARGLLFQALSTSTRRSREFRRRAM
jgi:hypothetical protein